MCYTDHPSYIQMIFAALVHANNGENGLSMRQIGEYIQNNYTKLIKGSSFNAVLLRALNKGIQRGQLRYVDKSLRSKSNYLITGTGIKDRNKQIKLENKKRIKWPSKKKKKSKSKAVRKSAK
eukprot:341800_1